jgi:hypothetical protein
MSEQRGLLIRIRVERGGCPSKHPLERPQCGVLNAVGYECRRKCSQPRTTVESTGRRIHLKQKIGRKIGNGNAYGHLWGHARLTLRS